MLLKYDYNVFSSLIFKISKLTSYLHNIRSWGILKKSSKKIINSSRVRKKGGLDSFNSSDNFPNCGFTRERENDPRIPAQSRLPRFHKLHRFARVYRPPVSPALIRNYAFEPVPANSARVSRLFRSSVNNFFARLADPCIFSRRSFFISQCYTDRLYDEKVELLRLFIFHGDLKWNEVTNNLSQ